MEIITEHDYHTAYTAVLDIADKCSCAVRDFAALDFALVIALEHGVDEAKAVEIAEEAQAQYAESYGAQLGTWASLLACMNWAKVKAQRAAGQIDGELRLAA